MLTPSAKFTFLNNECKAIALINNDISARILFLQLQKDRIALDDVCIILLRDINFKWIEECGLVLRYGGKPALTVLGQRKFIRFYHTASRIIKHAKHNKNIQFIYLVNNDNILTNAFFRWADIGDLPGSITVLAEGIMNYQQIGLENRAGWRWKIKKLLPFLLGLPYSQPTTHLSGSFEDKCDRVVSFSSTGLIAPTDKIHIVEFEKVKATTPANLNAGLIVQTGLWQWMSEDNYAIYIKAFSNWLKEQKYEKLYVKPHPRIGEHPLDKSLPEYELITDNRGIERMAEALPAANIIGSCCTALATLKLIRPELSCIDYGANFYCNTAYGGDTGVVNFLESTGVKLVQLPEYQ